MKTKNWILLALITVGTISASINADDVILPGVNCRYYGLIGNDTFFNPAGYHANGLKNTSTTTNYLVTCPIPKPLSVKTSGAWIILNDDSTICRLYRRGVNGTYTQWDAQVKGGANGTYLYYWEFGAIGVDTRDSSLAIYCRIDAGKYINNYFHQELLEQ